MISWEYRIGKKVYKSGVVDDDDYSKVIGTVEEDCFGIVECYYNDEGDIAFTSVEFQEPYGETLEDLKWSFDKMKEAFDKEVLDLDNIAYANY